MNRTNKSENGFITIEATFSLVMFIAAAACMVSLINIFILHNRIQYAITQTANQLSTYMYIYDGLGIKDLVDTFDENSDAATEDVNNAANDIGNTVISANKFGNSLTTVISQLGGIASAVDGSSDTISNMVSNSDYSMETISQVVNELKQIKSAAADTSQSIDKSKENFNELKQDFETAKSSTSTFVKSIQENPYTLVLTVFYLAADELEDYIKETVSENLACGLTQQYLLGDYADNYLDSAGVVGGYDGLNFKGSNVFEPITKENTGDSYSSDSSRSLNVLQIDIVVSYEVKLNFAFMPLSDNTITIVQRASTAAWTGHKND